MLTKKKLTKICNNEQFRKQIIMQMSPMQKDRLGLNQYAQYLVDLHASAKSSTNDDFADHGYPALELVGAVMKNGEVMQKLFEFKHVNKALAKKDFAKALEIVQCILVELALELKSKLLNFDIDKISSSFADLASERLSESISEIEPTGDENEDTK